MFRPIKFVLIIFSVGFIFLLPAFSGIRYPLKHAQPVLGDWTKPLPEDFFKELRCWYRWGTVSFLPPILILFLMVFKPKLWV